MLEQATHQISLLRNVLWWYLLPVGLSALPFFSHVARKERSGGWLAAFSTAFVIAIMVLVFALIYWLNQRAVKSMLEPRRRELETRLASLQDETPAAI